MSSEITRNNETVNEFLPATGFLRLPQILKLIPVSKSSIWAWIAKGDFPKPCKLGPRTTAWKTSDVWAWIESRGSG